MPSQAKQNCLSDNRDGGGGGGIVLSNKRIQSSECLREQLDERRGEFKQKGEVIGQKNGKRQIKENKAGKILGNANSL